MNSKERFLTALRGGVPDRVPVTPDFSNMIPAKRTGLPFWDVYFFEAVPLWEAYMETADYFGIEHWNSSCWSQRFNYGPSAPELRAEHKYDRNADTMCRRITMQTQTGELWQEEICFRFDPPTPRHKFMKHPETDWSIYRDSLIAPISIDLSSVEAHRKACGVRGQAFGMALGYPGLHSWSNCIEGGIEALSYLSVDNPEILDEWYELDLHVGTKAVELCLAQRPDYLFFGGSGTMTLSTPELVRRYSIPALKLWTKMAKEAGIPTLLHSCGKSRGLADMLCDETDLNCLNPLEVAPMGDVDLGEIKKARGARLALMGNLHTTDLMLRGTAEQVFKASVDAIQKGAKGGGFILSTGDQCPRDTPEENIFAMVRAAQERGIYDRSTGELALK